MKQAYLLIYHKLSITEHICVMLFLPHIIDTGAQSRLNYLQLFMDTAKFFRGRPLIFLWTEAGAESEIESALNLGLNYPSISVMSVEKKVFAVLRLSWSKKNINDFLAGVLPGMLVLKEMYTSKSMQMMNVLYDVLDM